MTTTHLHRSLAAIALVAVALLATLVIPTIAGASSATPVAPAAAGAGASGYTYASVGWRDASNGITKVAADTYTSKECTGHAYHSASQGYLGTANIHHGGVQVPGNYTAGKRYWARITLVTAGPATNSAGAACVQFIVARPGKWKQLTTPISEPTTSNVTFNWDPSYYGAGLITYYWSITSSSGSCDGAGHTQNLYVHCAAVAGTSYTFTLYAIDGYYLKTNSDAYGDKTAVIIQNFTATSTASPTTTTTKPTTTTTNPTTTTTSPSSTTTTTPGIPEGYYCAHGDVLTGTTCTHTATAPATAGQGYTCPGGWTDDGTKCVTVITTTEASCKNNNDTWVGGSSNNCEKFISATPVTTYTCPTGATLSGTTCTTVTTYPATYGPLVSGDSQLIRKS